MSDYKTTDYIVGLIYSLIAATGKFKQLKDVNGIPIKDVNGQYMYVPSGVSLSKYQLTVPDQAHPTEYIVINALPINANVMQICYANVNYHVKDIGPGMPDIIKIEAGSRTVLSILTKVSTTSYLIDFEMQETHREAQLGEHYSNLKFSCKFINY